MKWMTTVVCMTCLSGLLVGCGDRLTEIKEAASGINSAANSAADAMSKDVHSVRALTITYQEQTFTINDLFKTILRDARWEYDATKNQLQVTGTWLAPLFSEQNWEESYQKQLAETGEVTVTCVIANTKIDSALTNITLIHNGETLLHVRGEDALHHLYETYLQK